MLSPGRLREAATWASESFDMFRRWGHPGPARWSLGYLAATMAGRFANRLCQSTRNRHSAGPGPS